MTAMRATIAGGRARIGVEAYSLIRSVTEVEGREPARSDSTVRGRDFGNFLANRGS
ncbi:hypothetical protein [Streptomyces sp. SLBN-8D4]|uniref:hypothetical protein n=1 Tax=Streptomyces sp. SLBN-8D4 TaxID=3377728 RepID=UPI003C7D32F9